MTGPVERVASHGKGAAVFELLMGVAAIVAMVRIADADDLSPLLWGGITFLVLAACVALIPLPFVRVGIGFVAVFIGMIGYKVAANR